MFMGDESLIAFLSKHLQSFHVVDFVSFYELFDVPSHIVCVSEAFEDRDDLLKLLVLLVFKP